MSNIPDEIATDLLEVIAIYAGAILLSATVTGYSVYKLIEWIL